MIISQSIKTYVAVYLLSFGELFLFSSCLFKQGEGLKTPKIKIHHSPEDLLASLERKELVGVLPNLEFYQKFKGDFLYKDPFIWSEFFAFNRKVAILFLSIDPLYYLQIESGVFHSKLLREFQYIQENLVGKEKQATGAPFFKKIGNYQAEIYFTPTELNYSLREGSSARYRIRQIAKLPPRADVWRLMDAADHVIASFPKFQDTQMYVDFQRAVEEGKKRAIFSEVFEVSETSAVPLYVIKKRTLPFPFILGSKLRLTENLLDGQHPLGVNQNSLIQDFLLLLSLPETGNPQEGPSLNVKDGFALLLRGSVKAMERDLIQAEPKLPLDPLSSPCLIGVRNELQFLTFTRIDKDQQSVIIQNTSNKCINLNDAEIYIQRDSSCKIQEGKITAKHKLKGVLQAQETRIFRKNNSEDISRANTYSITFSSYCIALTKGNRSITSHHDPHILDFVIFGVKALEYSGAPLNPLYYIESSKKDTQINRCNGIWRPGEC